MKDEFELKICDLGSKVTMKMDDMDTMIMVFDSIMSKNKKKFENNIVTLDDGIVESLKSLVSIYKVVMK